MAEQGVNFQLNSLAEKKSTTMAARAVMEDSAATTATVTVAEMVAVAATATEH
jgi:hypothetical protein